jgi:hypothetical protein
LSHVVHPFEYCLVDAGYFFPFDFADLVEWRILRIAAVDVRVEPLKLIVAIEKPYSDQVSGRVCSNHDDDPQELQGNAAHCPNII